MGPCDCGQLGALGGPGSQRGRAEGVWGLSFGGLDVAGPLERSWGAPGVPGSVLGGVSLQWWMQVFVEFFKI